MNTTAVYTLQPRLKPFMDPLNRRLPLIPLPERGMEAVHERFYFFCGYHCNVDHCNVVQTFDLNKKAKGHK